MFESETFQIVMLRLEEIELLRDGWFDGSKEAIPEKVLVECRKFLQRGFPIFDDVPQIAPNPEKEVHIEWEKNGVGFFIVVSETEIFFEICSLSETFEVKTIHLDKLWIDTLLVSYKLYQKHCQI